MSIEEFSKVFIDRGIKTNVKHLDMHFAITETAEYEWEESDGKIYLYITLNKSKLYVEDISVTVERLKLILTDLEGA